MYPFDSLVIITPIVFFVLLIGFAVIGVFGGWKRAAYWGGGNFVFYCIGLLVWFLASGAIVDAITPIIKEKVPQITDASSLTKLATSVAAPAFFIIFMILINIILVVCYYTFAKKLLGLKKPKPEKDENGKKVAKAKQVKVAVKTQKGVVHTRWFNMVVGGVGMTALMLPITFTTAHAVALTTTKSSTRAKNSLTSNLYNCFQGMAESMDWFSYYNGDDTGKDYDALFSLISLTTGDKVTYKDSNGNLVTADAITATTNIISDGITSIVQNTKSSEKPTTELVNSINNFTSNFENLMSQVGDDVNTLFNSSGVTSTIKSIISSSEASISLDDATFQSQFVDTNSTYNQMVQGYKDGTILVDGQPQTINKIQNVITTSEEAFNDIVDCIYDMYPLNNLSSTNQELLREKTAEMIQMFITY